MLMWSLGTNDVPAIEGTFPSQLFLVYPRSHGRRLKKLLHDNKGRPPNFVALQVCAQQAACFLAQTYRERLALGGSGADVSGFVNTTMRKA